MNENFKETKNNNNFERKVCVCVVFFFINLLWILFKKLNNIVVVKESIFAFISILKQQQISGIFFFETKKEKYKQN